MTLVIGSSRSKTCAVTVTVSDASGTAGAIDGTTVGGKFVVTPAPVASSA